MSDRKERPREFPEIRIGISSCLLGEKVRFDGGHKRDGFLNETVSSFVSFVPVCPEVEVGMGTPREAIRLVAGPSGTRLLGVKSGTDHTTSMRRFSKGHRVAWKGTGGATGPADSVAELEGAGRPATGLDRTRRRRATPVETREEAQHFV